MPGHVFALKTDFDPILLENRNFSGLGVNTKVVDNGLFYLNTQFQLNPMLQNQENGQKPSKRHKIAYPMVGSMRTLVPD